MKGYNNNHNKAPNKDLSEKAKKIIADVFKGFKDWDKVRPQSECLHCHGTGNAPCSDGRTKCGFCKENK